MSSQLRALAAGIVVAGLTITLAVVAPVAAPRQRAGSTAAGPLTAADVVEIQQLGVRYTYALESGAGNGGMFADLFTRDAVFSAGGRSFTGRDQLLTLGRGRAPGVPRRFIVNHIVDPAPDGATGRVYVVEVDLPADGAEGGTITSIGGIYEDAYRKTPDGWRFSSRQFVPSKAAVRPAVSAANIAKPPAASASRPAPAAAPPAVTASRVPPPAAPAGGAPLAPADYLAIQHLVARYGYALDTGAPDGTGTALAALFTPDGVVEGTGIAAGTRGPARLAALARIAPGTQTRRGPNHVAHFQTNHLIEPTAHGAVGKVYVLEMAFGDNGQPHVIRAGGAYEDVYARTADGWRFKSRRIQRGTAPAMATWQWMPSALPIRPAAQDTAAGPIPSMDYLEIRRLVANYAYALDGGADEGGAYADNFAPGAALFGQVRTRDDMKSLASREPHGPQFTRHFLTNVLVEPGPSGPIGKQYLAVIDISEEGKESAIYLGGRYDDEYVKTPQGWKFKSRNLTRAR